MRAALLVSLVGSTAALAGPLAEIWPYQAKRLDAQTLEYSYDLAALKQKGGNPDVDAEVGHDKVVAYLKALPREVKVKVKTTAPLFLSAGRGVEQAALSTSFAAVPDGPLASDDPLRRKVKSRVRQPLDPDEPKVLPAAEMVLWRVRRLEDGALAAAVIDSDRLLKTWLFGLQEKALARAKTAQGDERDGALMLAARFAVALACVEPGRLSAKGEHAAEAKAQLDELRLEAAALTPLGFWAWNAELQCAWRRAFALGQPFAASRSGYAAGLVMLSLLKDPKAKATWLKLRGRRDALFGAVSPEPLQVYLEKANNDPDAALDDLKTLIDAQGRTVPPLFARATAPFQEFLASLQGAERLSAVEELSAAVAEGRVKLPSETTAPVEALREAALGALCVAEQPKLLQYDAIWRDRFSAAFNALQGSHHELRESSFEPSRGSEVLRSELSVVLEVPPYLEVEPLAELYRHASDSTARLAAVLTAEGLSGASVVDPDGQGGGNAVGELKKWQAILAGLVVLSTPGASDTPDVAAARRFALTWRSDNVLLRDVRRAEAGPTSFEGQRTHAAIAGVARRELSASFAEAPVAEIIGGVPGMSFDIRAEQRYLVPVLYTASYPAKDGQSPLPAPAVRSAVDGAKREPTQVPAALVERFGAQKK